MSGLSFKWPVLSLRDAYLPRPPVVWVVDGLFREASLSIVYGVPGALKSMLLADLCACIAAGQAWLEPMPQAPGCGVAVTQGQAFYVDLDNGSDTMSERIEAIGRARSLADSVPLFYTTMPSPVLDAGNPRHVMGLTDWIADNGGARVIVVDNLGLVSGGRKENENGMADVLNGFRVVAEKTRAATILLHHPVKQAGDRRAGDDLRGHSTILAALDAAFLVRRDAQEKDRLSVVCTKARGAMPEPFGARFCYEHKPGTRELAKACFYSAPTQATLNHLINRAILDTLGRARANQNVLVTCVLGKVPGVSASKVRNALKWLIGDGQVYEASGSKPNERAYYTDLTP